jgi:SAM-dependent methyltransferase
MYRYFKNLSWFLNDYFKIKSQLRNNKDFVLGKIFPILTDKIGFSGNAMGHYFHQDLYVAQKIFINQPISHVDIGSRIDGFVAHVASFREIEVLDIRANKIDSQENIKFRILDLMFDNNLQECSIDSISCLHVIEHFGLGRYGDLIDVNGHLKGLNSIWKLLKKGGRFYFSTPIGTQRIEFNAHRVFSIDYLLKQLCSKYHIECFSFVDDKGNFHKNIVLNNELIDNNCGCFYGCGIFELIKK